MRTGFPCAIIAYKASSFCVYSSCLRHDNGLRPTAHATLYHPEIPRAIFPLEWSCVRLVGILLTLHVRETGMETSPPLVVTCELRIG
jgi:hypothetical protein